MFTPSPRFRFNNSRPAAVYELGPLASGTNYVAPPANSSSQKCECNTVMFRYDKSGCAPAEQALIAESCSLYMACTACQNVSTQPWTFWSQYCSAVYVTQYPQPIPLNTSVPHWAYLDYTVRGRCRWRGVKSHVSHLPGLGRKCVQCFVGGGRRGEARVVRTSSLDYFTIWFGFAINGLDGFA